jgi:hypothetical protein
MHFSIKLMRSSHQRAQAFVDSLAARHHQPAGRREPDAAPEAHQQRHAEGLCEVRQAAAQRRGRNVLLLGRANDRTRACGGDEQADTVGIDAAGQRGALREGRPVCHSGTGSGSRVRMPLNATDYGQFLQKVRALKHDALVAFLPF